VQNSSYINVVDQAAMQIIYDAPDCFVQFGVFLPAAAPDHRGCESPSGSTSFWVLYRFWIILLLYQIG